MKKYSWGYGWIDVPKNSASDPVASDPVAAAAPDMLKALKRAEPALWIIATSGNADAIAILAECRAAIAKAEGRV